MFSMILLAQSGILKDIVGWVLVLLCLLLGALPIINPFGRKIRKKE